MKEIKIKIDKKTIWNLNKPLYNGYKCGHGIHGDTKYNRNKEKRNFIKDLKNGDL